jgi:hypothetical protein
MGYRLFLTIVLFTAVSASLSAAGPAEDPEKYGDFGGTPDLVLSGDVGMTSEELDALLQKLGSDSLETRVSAASEIKRNAAGCEGVMRRSLFQSRNVS